MAPASSQINAEAHAWFARLKAHDCSAAERAAFERWRTVDAAHAAAYDRLQDVWELSAELAEEDPVIIEAVRESRRATGAPAPRRKWPLLAAAASVVLAVALVFRISAPEDIPVDNYATATGEQRTLTLEDGSHVVLDTASVLEVRYGRRERSLTLQQGRADFQVHTDAARPFVVHAGQGSVTATGTQFQVRLDGAAGLVTLLEGQVIVASQAAGARAPLMPGERIAIDAAGTLGAAQRLSETELANAQGWTEGQLVVKEWPLETLVAEMNRYGQTPLRLGDASLRSLPVSGTFNPTEPESLALALQYGWPVRVERANGEIILRRK